MDKIGVAKDITCLFIGKGCRLLDKIGVDGVRANPHNLASLLMNTTLHQTAERSTE